MVVRRQAAHVGLAQEPRAGLPDLARLDEVRVPRPELPLAPVQELVAHQPAVEPQGLPVDVEVQQLRRADLVLGQALRVRVVAVPRVGVPLEGVLVRVLVHAGEGVFVGLGAAEFLFALGGLALGLRGRLEEADDAGVALVEDVVCVAYEFPAEPESFFVT